MYLTQARLQIAAGLSARGIIHRAAAITVGSHSCLPIWCCKNADCDDCM